MSVVRDILGVQAQTGLTSPVAAVMSVMTSKQSAKKRKSFLKEAREVMNLRDSEGLVKSPLHTPPGEASRRSWKWKKFKNSSAMSGEYHLLSHWDYRDDDNREYTATRCNVAVELAELSQASSQIISGLMSKYKQLTQDSIEDIFQLLKATELNFIVTADRSNSGLSVEQIKDIYYTVYADVFPHKKCKYSSASDAERRKVLEERQVTIATEGADKVAEMRKREKELAAELRDIENEIKKVESEASVIEKIINPEPKKVNQQAALASSEKKPPGYEIVYKYIPGIVELNAFLTGKPAEVPSSTIQMVHKTPIDFSAFTKMSANCTSYNSKRVMDFFARLAELAEMEKTLTAYIKKRDAEIKAAKKS